MILYYMWRFGLLGRTDTEKLRFFVGATADPLYLSRRWPLLTALDWVRALFVPRYARAAARWLAYRAELYDGLTG